MDDANFDARLFVGIHCRLNWCLIITQPVSNDLKCFRKLLGDLWFIGGWGVLDK